MTPAAPVEVSSVELKPWGKGTRYVALLADGTKSYLSRCTSVLNKLAKPALYNWYAEKASEYWFAGMGAFAQQMPDPGAFLTNLQAYHADAMQAAEREAAVAREVGSSVHRAIEVKLTSEVWPGWLRAPKIQEWMLGKCPWISDAQAERMALEVLHGTDAWERWWDSARLTPRNVELTVAHPELGYAGTLDAFCHDESGQLVLCDWKTSKGIYPEMLWQVAAYAVAAARQGHPVPARAIVVQIPKNLDQQNCKIAVAWDTRERLEVLAKGWRYHVEAQRLLPTDAQVKNCILA